MDEIRIGIQFNFDLPDKKVTIKQTPLLTALNMKSDGSHIDTYFTRKELKRFDPAKTKSEKVNMLKRLLRKYAAYSVYTNIYILLEADKLKYIKDVLQNTDFKEDRIRIIPTNKRSLLQNFETTITNATVFRFINKFPIIKVLNELFIEVANRDYALEQNLTTAIAYEDKIDYDLDTDIFDIGMQLEIP